MGTMTMAVTAGQFAKLQAQKQYHNNHPDNYYDRVSDYNDRKDFQSLYLETKISFSNNILRLWVVTLESTHDIFSIMRKMISKTSYIINQKMEILFFLVTRFPNFILLTELYQLSPNKMKTYLISLTADL